VPADARAVAEIGVLGWQAAYRDILSGDFLAGLSVGPREVAWRSMLESDEEGLAPELAGRAGGTTGRLSSRPARLATRICRSPRPRSMPCTCCLMSGVEAPAARLLAKAVDHWRADGVTTLVLWVLEANLSARSFYESQGWRPDGAAQSIDVGGAVNIEVRYRLGIH